MILTGRQKRTGIFFSIILLFILLGNSTCQFRKPQVTNPEGFAELNETEQYAAMSPEGMIFRIRTVRNTPVQGLDFWAEALNTQLKKEGYINVSVNSAFASGESKGLFSEWTVPYQGETHKYLVALLADESVIAIAEAGAEHSVYALYRDSVVKSLETIDFVGADVPEAEELKANYPVVKAFQSTQSSTSSSSNERPRSGGCFLSGTEVMTDKGGIPIEYLWPGTMVKSFNAREGTWAPRMVTRTIELSYSGDIIILEMGGNRIEVTGNHPLFVKSGRRLDRRPLPEELTALESLEAAEGRWVEARYVRIGDQLISSEGDAVKVDFTASRIGVAQVYHLTIDDLHTFAVSPDGIAVHNGGEQGSVKEEFAEVREREQQIIGSGAYNASLPKDAGNDRVRVYSGACTMMIDSVEDSKREIAAMAESVGGYVEMSTASGIVIRVPAETFRDSFDNILLLGDVVHKAIETYDVTSKYTDSEGRLAVAIRARDRLYTVLKRVEDPKERLEILQKIRQYSDTIEKLELSKQVLEQRIALSRITVDLKPRIDESAVQSKKIPYRWVENLHPLYASTEPFGEAVHFELPDNIAVFEDEETIRAEAADGTRIRIGTVDNNPEGDSLFWSRALIYHLGPKYSQAENIERETMNFVIFESKTRNNPYRYLVGARPFKDGKKLIVFEVFFPDLVSVDRHLESILEKLSSEEESL